MVRPYIKDMLVIYMKLINDFENETLICSLNGIFETFTKDLKPYINEILDGLIKVTLKLLNKTF